MELTPISETEFRKKLKGCGIKYYSRLPKNELKARLGFCPLKKLKRNIEISDDFGFSKIFESMTQAARDCEISNPSAIKYALDNGRSTIKRRSDKKNILHSRNLIFRIKNIFK